MNKFLDFEKPIAELVGKIEELRHLANNKDLNIADEVSKLQLKADKMMRQTYTQLTPWQKVQVARHPDRPKFSAYINAIFTDFVPLAGDRLFADDQSIVGGLATLGGVSVMVIGQEKGNDTESRVKHNFGMPKPEGYRKAQRLMDIANRFKLPVITFIDTPGAYPGIDAEERGQAEAIAKSIEKCLTIEVPLITIIIGEGSSGGAIAIATANSVLMLEHAIYAVISPEGCASILWRSSTKAAEAAEAQKLTAQDLLTLGVIDAIIPEPIGGAQRFPTQVVESVRRQIEIVMNDLMRNSGPQLKQMRREKFLHMGQKSLG
ncbi:MAG: acetyl-CoA carboxylase carboxyltransferase subunit alpha [Alphaproteobacteria bacterium]